jgi:hypothetical protein
MQDPNSTLRTAHFRLRLSDLVLLVYIAAVSREFLWGIRGETLAWVLTTVVSVVILATHAFYREDFVEPDSTGGSSSKLTLIAYAAPLVAVFLVRVPFPDYNYDVLNYHLEHMERGLRGWPFISGDFFPSVVQFNPAGDIATGIAKYLLGFRLGVLINLAAILWTASTVERFLRGSIDNEYLRRLGALVVVSTELVLFLQSMYLVDLLALPLLAEATLLAATFKSVGRKRYSLIHIGLFLGISLAFKISNIAFVIPIGALALYQAYVCRREFVLPPSITGMIAAIVAPAAPFFIFLFMETGSPVFPLYNRVFRSPYWTPDNISVPGIGPQNILQTLLWPFWVCLYPERGSEYLNGENPYTGRIALGFIFAAACLFTSRFSTSVRLLGLMTASSILLWSASSGNLRYGLFAEVLGGLLIVSVLASLLSTSGYSDRANRRKLAVLASSFSLLIAIQVFGAYKQALTSNQIFYGKKVQPTIFQDVRGYIRESAYLFRDRNMRRFLNSDEQQTVDGINVWVNSYPGTVGIMASLKPEIPIIAVTLTHPLSGSYDPLKTAAARERYEIARRAADGKHLFTIALEAHLDEALGYLKRGGLRPTHIQTWQLPYYSPYTHIKVVLIELENAAPNQSTNAIPAQIGK